MIDVKVSRFRLFRIFIPVLIFLFLASILLILMQSETVKAEVSGPGTVTFTKTDTLVNDVSGNGEANPSDTLRYDMTINNTTMSDLTTVVMIDILDANVTWDGMFKSTPLAFSGAVTTTEDIPIPITLTGGDLDGDTLTFSIITPPTNGSLGAITPQTATTASVTYTPNLGYTGSDSFTFQVMDDDGNIDSDTINVTISLLVNNPPTLDLDADNSTGATGGDVNVVFIEAGGAITLSNGISIVDPDNPNLVSGAITLTNPLDTVSETLAINSGLATGFGISVIFGTNNHNIDLNGSATLAQYRQVLETVTYNNISADPNTTTRQTTFMVNDGSTDSNMATASITVTAVNLPPIANSDMYTATGNTLLAVGSMPPPSPVYTYTGSVLDNDVDQGGGGLSIQNSDTTSVQGGTVSMQPNGTFTYLPPVGFEGADSFTYIVTDTVLTDTTTVNLTVVDVIWYIDNSAVGGGDGRSQTPFNSLNAYTTTATDEADDFIFIHRGTGTSTNLNTGITLLNNQKLIGQGVNLVHRTQVIVPATSNPIMTNSSGNGVTLASGNTIRGLTIGNTSGVGISDSGVTVGNLTISDVTINGTGGGFEVDNGGTLNATFTELSASSNSDEGIHIVATGGFTVITGSITTNGIPAIVIDGNPTVVLNTTLQSVTTNTSSTTGITIQNTTGSFVVTGVGTTNGSGGTIQDITQRGASFINTTNITLNNMIFDDASIGNAAGCTNISNTACFAAIHLQNTNTVVLDNVDITDSEQQGINGTNITNFTLRNSTVSDCGNGVVDNCLWITNLTGTSIINNSDLSFGTERVALIQNTNAANLALTVTNSTFRDTQFSGAGDSGLEVDFLGSSTGSVDVSGSSFLRNRTTAVQIFARDTAVVDVDIKTSTFSVDAGIGRGPEVGAEDNAKMTFEISNNPTITARGGVAIVAVAIDSANLQGAIENNTNINMNADAGAGIFVASRDNATGIVTINNNTVNLGTEQRAIQVIANTSSGISTLDTTINNNTVNLGGTHQTGGIHLWHTNNNQLCGNINGNQVNASGVAMIDEVGLIVENWSSNTTKIQGLTSTLDAMWTINGNATNTNFITVLVGTGTATNGTCTTPTLPTSSPLNTNIATESLSNPQISQPTIMTAPASPDGHSGFILGMGTIPAGKSITISVDVTIDDPFPDGVTQVSNQAQITASGGLNMFSDDPDTPAPDDPTVTPVIIIPSFDFTKQDTLLVDADGNNVASPGDTIQYVVAFLNTGNNTLNNVQITDTVDANTTYDPASLIITTDIANKMNTPQGNPSDVNVVVNPVPVGQGITLTFNVEVNDPFPTGVSQISNQAFVNSATSNIPNTPSDDPDTPANYDPTITPIETTQYIYLPVVLNNYANLPDLVVNSLTVAGNSITIEITNIGNTPSTESFWVDAYINPNPPPTAVNQTWDMLSDEGMAWGVTQSLAPGEIVTLTIGGTYFDPLRSNFSGTISAGAQVYVQVDSANVATTYGAVQETHEYYGDPYINNILFVTAISSVNIPLHDTLEKMHNNTLFAKRP